MWNRSGPRPVWAAAALAAACACAPAQAATATMDFEAVDFGPYNAGDSLLDAGFRLTMQQDFAIVEGTAGCWVTCPTGNDTRFFQGFNDSHVTLAEASGKAFRLLGFDAGFILPVPVPNTDAGFLQLRATTLDGTIVSKSYTFGVSDDAGSFAFRTMGSAAQPLSGLGWLRSVEFFACTWDADGGCANPNENLGQFALDNIRVNAVPEPGTYGLMALGLAGLAALRRRRA